MKAAPKGSKKTTVEDVTDDDGDSFPGPVCATAVEKGKGKASAAAEEPVRMGGGDWEDWEQLPLEEWTQCKEKKNKNKKTVFRRVIGLDLPFFFIGYKRTETVTVNSD